MERGLPGTDADRTLLRLLALLACALVALAVPSVASAANIAVTIDGSNRVTLTSDASNTVDREEIVEFEGSTFDGPSGTHTVEIRSANLDDFVESLPNCSVTTFVLECSAVSSSIVAKLGPGPDTFRVTALLSEQPIATVHGGPGNDDISGGTRGDRLFGGGDSDTIDGLDGGDEIDGYLGFEFAGSSTEVDGTDVIRGGRDADVVYDSSGSLGDALDYSGDLTPVRDTGVTVTYDGQPNDGSAAYDDGGDTLGPGIDRVEGTDFADTMTGDSFSNLLVGRGGNDTLTGGNGHDELFGGGDDDTLNARDDTADATIDCGGGAGDVANVDAADPAATACATVNRLGASGTTTTTTTTPGATGKTPPPLPPAGDPAADKDLNALRTRGTSDRSKMPSLVAKRLDNARDALDRLGITYDLDLREVTSSKKGMQIGDVLAQQPKAGTVIRTDADSPRKLRLELVEGPGGRANRCPSADELKQLRGVDFDIVELLLKARGCRKIAVIIKESEIVPLPSATDFKRKGDTTTVTVAVPAQEKRNDLFLIVRESAVNRSDLQSFGLDWTLPDKSGAFGVQVIDRAGRFVRNAEVTFDQSAVGAAQRSLRMKTEANGELGPDGTGYQANEDGVIKILAKAVGRDGKTLWGSAQIRVRGRGQAEWSTTLGRRFLNTTCRVGFRSSETGGGCVTHWLGAQEIPDENYGGRVRRGPDIPEDSAAFDTYAGMLRAILTFDEGALQLLSSSSVLPVNRIRTLVNDTRYQWQPAQLVVEGNAPLSVAPALPQRPKGKLWALKGASTVEYDDELVGLGSAGVFVAARKGGWSMHGGFGRDFDNQSDVVDAAKATVVTFPDGTSVLSDGDTPPSAGATGITAVYGN